MTQNSEWENHILRFVSSNYTDKESQRDNQCCQDAGTEIKGKQGFLFQFYKKKKNTSGRNNG